MKLTFVAAGKTIDLGEFAATDGLLCLEVDGEMIVGIDVFYADGAESSDPQPGAPDGPHINIGHWTEPEGEGYEVLAFKPQNERKAD